MWHTNGSKKSVFPGSKGVAHVFAPKKMKPPTSEAKKARTDRKIKTQTARKEN